MDITFPTLHVTVLTQHIISSVGRINCYRKVYGNLREKQRLFVNMNFLE